MELLTVVFLIFALLILGAGLAVVLSPNPVYSALSLALCLSSVAGLFFVLEAYFLAAVQLALYAGAVVVLFVMVVMLFDLKKEIRTFSEGSLLSVLKVASAAVFLATLISSIVMVVSPQAALVDANRNAITTSQELALQLFTKYVLPFEFVGFLLLVVLVGALSLAKQAGGTHEDSGGGTDVPGGASQQKRRES